MWDLDTIKRINRGARRVRMSSIPSQHRTRIELNICIKRVLNDNQSLALDNDKDRAVLLRRLLEAL